MDALELLLNRRSHGRLTAPAPLGEARQRLFQAAVNVPDHGRLRPWRLITVEGEGLARLGQIFAEAEQARGGDDAAVARAANLPLRAPLMVVVVACPKPHDKVPEWEQVASACCAAHSVQMAAFGQGFGAIWRTGYFTTDERVCQGLALADHERIVGFVYVGTPLDTPQPPPPPDLEQLVTPFSG